jgi:hypothetical protein
MTTSLEPTEHCCQVDSQVPPSQNISPIEVRRKSQMPETPTFGRYAEILVDQMTPEQEEGYRSLVEARGPLGGPNKIWAHNPGLAKVMGPLGAYFRTGYSLSEREREIAVIIIINSKWHSIYPTNAHERAGKAAGLPAEKVEALLSGLPASFDDDREQIVSKSPPVWPIRAGSPRESGTARLRRSATRASPMSFA